jgi:hypothetical protein
MVDVYAGAASINPFFYVDLAEIEKYPHLLAFCLLATSSAAGSVHWLGALLSKDLQLRQTRVGVRQPGHIESCA